MWQNSKINYVFVFEFDTRHHLDWRQLCEVRSIPGFPEYVANRVTASMSISLLSGPHDVAQLQSVREQHDVYILSRHPYWPYGLGYLFPSTYLVPPQPSVASLLQCKQKKAIKVLN